jgi:hypothetical protein
MAGGSGGTGVYGSGGGVRNGAVHKRHPFSWAVGSLQGEDAKLAFGGLVFGKDVDMDNAKTDCYELYADDFVEVAALIGPYKNVDAPSPVTAGMGACNLCSCKAYRGISGQHCSKCGHSPSDHS